MKLYYAPSACSLSPHIVLRECQLPFELERVALKEKKTAAGQDYLTINPKGYVPALKLDNGEMLTEGPAIVQYLADLAPQTKLAPPAGTLARYHLQEWLNFVGTEIHKTLGTLFFRPNLAPDTKQYTTEVVKKRFDFLNHQLADKPFLMGTHFTVADAYLFTVLRWTTIFNMDIKSWPALVKYIETINLRPAVQEALSAEKG